MKKFMAFLYKFSTVVMLIVGIILCTLVAAITGLIISKGADGLKTVVDLLAKIKLDKDQPLLPADVVTNLKGEIDKLFQGIHWSTKDLDVAGKVLLSIFSVNTGLLGMFVVFGILSVGYRVKVKKAGKKALKQQKQEAKVAKSQQYSYYSF